MLSIVTTVISLVELLLPNLGVGSAAVTTIDTIINGLVQILPTIVAGAEDLVQPVKNIIAALSANPATTDAQLATLQTLDAQVDAAFEAAATADGAAPASTPAAS